MDISLHSFILAVGVVVIAFIVWDGIKKVRENRGQALDIEFEPLDSDALHEQLDSLQVYDEFEIDEVLLKGALKESVLSDSIAENVSGLEPQFKPKIEGAQEPTDKLADFPLHDDDLNESQPEPAVIHTQESLSAETVTVVAHTDVQEFEHFSAHGDEPVVPVEVVEVQSVQSDTHVAEQMLQDEIAHHLETLTAEIEQSGVPVLMEPVALGRTVEPNPPKQHELHLPEFVQQTLNEEAVVAIDEPVEEALNVPSSPDEASVKPVLRVGERLAERPPAQEVFVINVVKKSQPLLQGFDLNRIFQACDLRFGEMEIFHRFEKANAQGKIQFSVVNSLNPGTFDLDTIDDMQTSGISFFMSLPGPENPMEAFNAMAETAMVFSRNFNAILHDESHSDLNPQTLEHYRQRIRDYSRKHLSKLK